MASEIFLAIFRTRFDARYDVSNESGLRWWINKNIRDFIAPTFICGNPLNVYGAVRRTPSEGTPVDNGRILPYFPQPDGYRP